MSLSRAAIVDQLKEIVGADRVITDETVLKSRYRLWRDDRRGTEAGRSGSA